MPRANVWGGLLQGLSQGLQQGVQMKRQRETLDRQKEFFDLKKKDAENKIKQQELQQNWLADQSQAMQDAFRMPKGLPRDIAMMQAQFAPKPQMGPPAPGVQLPPGIAGPPAPGVQPPAPQQPSIADLMARAQTEPLIRGALKKTLGFDPGEREYRKGLAGPKGRPVTKAFGPMGEVLGEYPQAVKPQMIERVTPKGAKVGDFYDPYTQERRGPQLQLGPPEIQAVDITDPRTGEKKKAWVNPRTGESEIATAPAERVTRTYMEDGITKEAEFNKITGERIGVPRLKKEEKAPEVGAAGKIQLAKTGLNEITNTIFPNLFNEDGTPNRTILTTAMGDGVPGTEGRTIKQAFRRASDAIIRAATGAALNEKEMENYESQYFPSPFDSDEAVKNKTIALENFLSGYLGMLDPTGRLREKGVADIPITTKGQPSLKVGKPKVTEEWEKYLQ